MFKILSKFVNDESGATAIEYGLIAAATGLVLPSCLRRVAAGVRKRRTYLVRRLCGYANVHGDRG